jgi:Protein of unknown function (DUF2723)
MNFRKINNLTGWAVFLVAMATYMLTREARASLWDTGEFIASADKLQLPHPPGAPFFTLLGRLFIILFGDKPMTAANAVNFMSAFASAATILFLFWSITHFARKMFVRVGEQLSGQQVFTTMAAGVVGALAYTFSDSFWFSAVEGEVYALSSLFTALVFWAMLKWEHADEHAGNDPFARARSDRWIIFLFFMMGLSIGVHLLNLLTIPAIIMIYYFRRHFKEDLFNIDAAQFRKDKMLLWAALVTIGVIILLIVANASNSEKDTTGLAMICGLVGIVVVLIRIYTKYPAIRNLLSAFIIGCLVTGIVQVAIIQYSMKAAGLFDVFFVNSLNLPFFSGFVIYFIVLAAVIGWAFTFTEKNSSRSRYIIWFTIFLILSALPFFLGAGTNGEKIGKFLVTIALAVLAGYFFKPTGLRVLKLSLWCYAFMMLGYFLYFTSMIRSNANPAIDMNNVDNPINLVYYLSREQYGSAPIVYGPHFSAEYESDPDSYNGVSMKKGEMRYVKTKDRYVPAGTEDEPKYKSEDMQWFPRVWDRSNDQGHATFYSQWLNLPQDPQTGAYKAPTYKDNFEWFFTYQVSLMYWRYFMWNFGGKQNDIQGFGNARDGNWISGIPFVDNTRLGDQGKMPESIRQNKAHNQLYMLPFILGILGCVYQYFKNRKDWIVTFLLFFLTGIAVVIYLNQPGGQPRERDYAYVGSFYAFAIWIGLSVVGFVKMAREKTDKQGFQNVLIYGSGLTFIITLMSTLRGSFSSILITCVLVTLLYALVTAGVTYLIRALSSGGKNWGTLNIASSVLCLFVPILMAQQEWDDHDRSKKTLAPDLAKDYLESCAPNAIIFTFGDNDTYPLWYAQEVEGVRPDIRIINNSLLGIDWYVNQLRYKINESDSVDVIFTPEQLEGHNREFLRYRPKGDQNRHYDLYDVLKSEIARESLDEFTKRDVGASAFPVSRIGVPVDIAAVKANGTVTAQDTVVSPLLFEIPKRKLDGGLYRNDLIILSIIATNKWKRPIYFTSAYGELGFWNYLRKDGLAYRLVPVQNKYPQQNWVIEQTMNQIQEQYKVGLGGTQVGDNNDSVMYRNLMEKFVFGGADKKGTYFDEENRRHLLNIRSVFSEAAGNLSDKGEKDKGLKLLEKAEAGILPANFPYAMVSRFSSHNQTGLLYLEASYKAGKADLAERIRLALHKDIDDQKRYFEYLKENRPELYTGSLEGTEVFLNNVMAMILDALEKRYAPQTQPKIQVEGNAPPIFNNPLIDSNRRDTSK